MVSRKNWGLSNINKSEEEWSRVFWVVKSNSCLINMAGLKGFILRLMKGWKKGSYVEECDGVGFFCADGGGKLDFVDGKVNLIKYIEMLCLNRNCLISKLYIFDPIFQQDNTPFHTSRLTKEYFTTIISKLWTCQLNLLI